LHVVSGRFERSDGRAQQGSIEALGFGMGKNKENVHQKRGFECGKTTFAPTPAAS
jgi:hypothetical protein